MDKNISKNIIIEGEAYLGIELGSTRIKSVLINSDGVVLSSGSHSWENQLENGIWTYSLQSVWSGIADSYAKLKENVLQEYGVKIESLAGMGFSGMMHGYLAFDNENNILVPFRTWRNTTTEHAAKILTKELLFNIPQRWSIAHLYQAILNNEPHVGSIAHITTLAGYVHMKLTGKKVLGIGDASGVFPIDSVKCNYNEKMAARFDELISQDDIPWKLHDILPKVLQAGEEAGKLTQEGALLIDPSGDLKPGISACPPEGDAGTGMTATNSIAEKTGNVSAGTSIFAMVVLEKELSEVYTEVDMVTTPTGRPVAMVHCNNCTSELDAWVKMFKELLELSGSEIDMPTLYDNLYFEALKGDADCGGMVIFNYFSGETITNLDEGRPLFTRKPDSKLTLANFMRSQLYSTVSTLKIGMEILFEKEGVNLLKLMGHGGLFKTKDVGQKVMASALNVPISVLGTAGEGGAWGIAVLAAYMQKGKGQTLEEYLNNKIFVDNGEYIVNPDEGDVAGFTAYVERYKAALGVEKAAITAIR